MALFGRNGSNGRNEAAMRHMRLDDQPNSSPPPWSYYRRLLISRERRAAADSARNVRSRCAKTAAAEATRGKRGLLAGRVCRRAALP